jgi:hypothetical protein
MFLSNILSFVGGIGITTYHQTRQMQKQESAKELNKLIDRLSESASFFFKTAISIPDINDPDVKRALILESIKMRIIASSYLPKTIYQQVDDFIFVKESFMQGNKQAYRESQYADNYQILISNIGNYIVCTLAKTEIFRPSTWFKSVPKIKKFVG